MLGSILIESEYDERGQEYANCFPQRVAHGPSGTIAMESFGPHGITRIFHKRDDGRIVYAQGATKMHDWDAIFDAIKQHYDLVEDGDESNAGPDLPEITVSVVRGGDSVGVYINGNGAEIFPVTRDIYGAMCDDKESVVFWRDMVCIDGPTILPEKPEVSATEAEWREWALAFKSVVQERIKAVKSAFSQDFEFEV